MSWHQAVLQNSEELVSAQMGGQVTYFMHIHWNNKCKDDERELSSYIFATVYRGWLLMIIVMLYNRG